MTCTRTYLYVFTCQDCPAQFAIPAGGQLVAERQLQRDHGWGVKRGRHRCPPCRQTRQKITAAATRSKSQIHAGRVEDYAELRSWGLERREAAERLGVTLRTLDRYDAELRQRRQVAA